jgi:hypothetical protein
MDLPITDYIVSFISGMFKIPALNSRPIHSKVEERRALVRHLSKDLPMKQQQTASPSLTSLVVAAMDRYDSAKMLMETM